MTIMAQVRQTTRNGLVVAALLAAMGGVGWLAGPASECREELLLAVWERGHHWAC